MFDVNILLCLSRFEPMREADWLTRPLLDELGEALRAELLSWPGVTLKPMMGTLCFWRNGRMLGCYVSREVAKSKPAWLNRPGEPTYVCVRLREEDAARALRREGVVPPRLGFKSWVEIPLASRRHLEEAVRWFGVAYERPPRRAVKRAKRKPPRRKLAK